MELCILTAVSGVNKTQALQKIAAALDGLKKDGRKLRWRIEEVEAKLEGLCSSDREADWGNREQDPLVSIISQRPQDKGRAVWRQAFKKALVDVTAHIDGEPPDLGIIVASLSYYRQETFEFYSPVDLKSVVEDLQDPCPLRVNGILTLIDDIHDVYSRLSQPEHVFAVRSAVTDLLGHDDKGATSRYKKALGLVIQNLVRVLQWRENEIKAAASLGAALDAQVSVLAMKHPVETGVRLLLGAGSTDFSLGQTFPVYVSHPISQPRKDNAKNGDWPDFVGELAAFVSQLRASAENDCYITPILPTAIDEYRFLKDGEKLLPRLAPRWPLSSKKDEPDLLYGGAEGFGTYQEYEERCLQTIFAPPLYQQESDRAPILNAGERVEGMLMGDAEVSGMLKTLESLIKLQMANRDHLLVRQCPGFLMYRPTYQDDPRFTDGVRAELKHFHRLRAFESEGGKLARPVAVVHSVEDLRQLFEPSMDFVARAAQNIHSKASEILRPEDGVPGMVRRETVAKALSQPGELTGEAAQVALELFPSKAGPISHEQLPSGAKVQETVEQWVLNQRAEQLCHSAPHVGWKWQYVYVSADGTNEFTATNIACGDIPIILILVVENIATDENQRAIAADLVRRHFVKYVQTPAHDK